MTVIINCSKQSIQVKVKRRVVLYGFECLSGRLAELVHTENFDSAIPLLGRRFMWINL